MFLKAVLAVTLCTSLLVAAEPSNSDIFSLRSFIDPKTKAKIAVTAQLFAKADPQELLTQALKEAQKIPCAIPLVQAPLGKIHDDMAQFAGPTHDSGGVIPPPVPACKGRN